MTDIAYAEAREILESFASDGVVQVQRGDVPSYDGYTMTEYGIWLMESGFIKKYISANAAQKKVLRWTYDREKQNEI